MPDAPNQPKTDVLNSPISTTSFFTDDLDHAVEYVKAGFGDHSRIVHNRGRFEYGHRSFSGNAMTMASVITALTQVIRAAVPEPATLVHLPLTRQSEYTIGRRLLRSSPLNPVVIPGGYDYSMRAPGGRNLALAVKTEALATVLESGWQGRRGHLVLRPVELKLSAESQAQLNSMYFGWAQMGRQPPAQQNPQAVGDLERRLLTWLACELANHAGLQPLSPRSRLRVEAICRWIDTHLDEDIDLDRLAAVSGVGPRALAKLCEAARGVSPMQLLQSRRLLAAHRLLVQGDERVSVTHVAHECGLSHLGRFAGAYRDAYGESPSDTLARSRQSGAKSPT